MLSEKMDLFGDEINAVNTGIDSPIDQRNTGKGNPNAIIHAGRPLNNRQQKLLELLPEFDCKTVVNKKTINMSDLSALTAVTGVEFAMFTKGQERLIIRGDDTHVKVDEIIAINLNKQGYKWSGHTHPGIDKWCLIASDGDKAILSYFDHDSSVIYNSSGQFEIFNIDIY